MKLKNRLAQGLPLNTIVIALLVIIVLVVIVVFFTSKTSESGQTIDKTRAELTTCSDDNPAIIGYSEVDEQTGSSCSGDGFSRIPGISAADGKVCCGKLG